MLRLLLILFIFQVLFLAKPGQTIVNELSANFNYQRQMYGLDRQNKSVERIYAGSWALYLWSTTALEFNFTQDDDIVTENESIDITGTQLEITSVQTRNRTRVYGLGLRQLLAPKDAFLLPSLSLGYAKQFVSGSTEYTLKDNSDNSTLSLMVPNNKSRIDSAFATFTLRFRLTRTFTINGSVNTVFKAMEFNQAKDYLKYSAGFSWFF
jgi:hypothetical protein